MSTAEYDTLLFAAHAKALSKLSELLDAADDPREIRLIATSILRLRPLSPPAAAPPAAATPALPSEPPSSRTLSRPAETSATQPAPSAPLTPAELAELAAYLPHVPPARFTKKHTPAYWREALTLQRRRHPSPASAAA